MISANPDEINQPKKIHFNIKCDARAGEFKRFIEESVGISTCNIFFEVSHPAGCVNWDEDLVVGPMTRIAFTSLSVFAIYFLLGAGWNVLVNNLEGDEAIPNKAFWVGFWNNVLDGIRIHFVLLRETKNCLLMRKKSQDQGYEGV